MTLTTYDDQQAYWTERDWATDAPIKISSRIDTPKPLSDNDVGRTFIGGIAWAQGVGIGGVEVRIDGGPWRPATLGADAGDDYWRQWYVEWDAEPGPALRRQPSHEQGRRRADGCPHDPLPRGVQRHPGDRRQRRLNLFHIQPIRLARGTEHPPERPTGPPPRSPSRKAVPMNRIARNTGLATLALTLSLGMAACGSDEDAAGNDASASETSSETSPRPVRDGRRSR